MRAGVGPRFAAVASLTFLVATLAPGARAQTPTSDAVSPQALAPLFTLEWEAPRDGTGAGACPDEPTVRREIARRAEGVAPLAEPRFRAHASITRLADTTFRVELTTRVGSDVGTRTLAAPTCRALADATVVVLAMLLAPSPTTASAPPPLAPPPPVTKPTPAVTPPEADGPVPPARASILAAAVGDLGSLPGAAVGAHLGVAWRPHALLLEVGASYFPSASGFVGTSTAGGRMTLFTFELRACRPFELAAPGSITLAPCVSAEAGRLAGEGVGIVNRTTGEAFWVAVAPGAVASLPFARERLALRIGADAWLPLNRPTFVLGGVGNVHQPSPVAGRATVGIELRFR